MKTLAILTPTYNRAYIITKLYESLMRQTCDNFKWYVVDDGSTDTTEETVKSFWGHRFEIAYIKKTNGGKHTALNEGLKYIKEELTFIVDSDDYLSDNAVETIVSDWHQYGKEPRIGGLSYYKMHKDGEIIGDPYERGIIFADTYTNIRVNDAVAGDKAEVYRTDILKDHPFPEFPGERFLSEAIVWNAISKDGYKLVFIGKGICFCEYLPDGLTSSGRKYRLQNPMGTMEHAKSFLYGEVQFKYRLKYMLLYTATRPFAKMSVKEAFAGLDGYKASFTVCLLPGALLALFWKMKYRL